jgi:TetR/AcrR family transcriptional regulator
VASLPEHLRSTPAGEGKISREVRGGHQRDRVLVAALPIFAKRGYQGTSVDDLVSAGKVGFGNFYDLFEGKEDCFLACFERVVGGARSEMTAAAASGSGWAGATYLGLHRLIAVMLAAPLEARLALVEAQSAGSEALGRYNALLDQAIGWLQRGRQEFASARRLPAGFEQAAVSGLAFYLQQCLLDSRRHEVSELFRETADLVLGPIVGPDQLRRLRDSAITA